MRNTIKNIVSVALLATAINSAPVSIDSIDTIFGTSVAEAGNRCRKDDDRCNRSTGGAHYKGTDNTPNKLKVTVCHGYWDQLDVGTYRGKPTRWWQPVIVKGAWKSTPTDTFVERCTTMYRRYGEQVAVFASCVNRVIWTPPITVSGKTYTMY